MLRDFASAFIYSPGITHPVLVCSQGDAEKLAWSKFKSMIKGLLKNAAQLETWYICTAMGGVT